MLKIQHFLAFDALFSLPLYQYLQTLAQSLCCFWYLSEKALADFHSCKLSRRRLVVISQ